MSWDDPRLSKFTASTHELVQSLCHTETCYLNCVLLLIRDRSGRALVGIWMKCDIMIKAAHQHFLDVAHAHGLKWACEHVDSHPKIWSN